MAKKKEKKMMEISLSRALTELKMMRARIDKGISGGTFYGETRKGSNRVKSEYSLEDFDKKVKADYQSVVDLIERCKIFKEAIDAANAVTPVIIAEKDYTILSAINRKNSIILDKKLLEELKSQRRWSINYVENKNMDVEEKLENILLSQSRDSDNKDKKSNAETTREFTESFRGMNEWEVVDPLNLDELINELETDISSFEADVDASLSEVNATTLIEVPL